MGSSTTTRRALLAILGGGATAGCLQDSPVVADEEGLADETATTQTPAPAGEILLGRLYVDNVADREYALRVLVERDGAVVHDERYDLDPIGTATADGAEASSEATTLVRSWEGSAHYVVTVRSPGVRPNGWTSRRPSTGAVSPSRRRFSPVGRSR